MFGSAAHVNESMRPVASLGCDSVEGIPKQKLNRIAYILT